MVHVESDEVFAMEGIKPIVGLVVQVSDGELPDVSVGRSENVLGGQVKGHLSTPNESLVKVVKTSM